ncbi:TetR/AcrR family transcriptional regulator [Salana multivorans]
MTTAATTGATPRVPRGKRGPYAKSRGTREAILEAALEVFASSGYRAGSVASIAEKIGMTEAGIAYHFPTKVALLDAVLIHRDERSREIAQVGEDAVTALRGVVRLARRLDSARGLVELYSVVSAEAVNPEHPAHQHFVRQREKSREIFGVAFAELAERGLLAPGLPARLAADICSSHLDGVQVQWLLAPGDVDLPGQVELLLRQFVPRWDALVAEAEAAEIHDESTDPPGGPSSSSPTAS